MPSPKLFDDENLDFDNPEFTIDDIREINPQRHDMEQLTAVVHVDREQDGLVGYKDVSHEEFWISGHMPDFPLMPGVILCEAAAQLAGFYARKYDILGGDFLGFGGMNEVRFRRPVFPGDRLVLMVKLTSVRRNRRAIFIFQGWVDGRMAFNGEMIGVPINREAKPE